MTMKRLLLFVAFLASHSNAEAQQLEWAKQFSGSYQDIGIAIQVNGDGDVYAAGNFNDTLDCDPSTGTYFLTSNFTAGLQQANGNAFISKSTSAGDFIWAKQIGKPDQFTSCQAMVIDDSDNIYIAGVFYDTVDFDPGPNEYNLYSDGFWVGNSPGGAGYVSTDMFVLKLDQNGDFLWARAFNGSANDKITAMTVDNSGSLSFTGTISGDTDFDPGQGSHIINGFGTYWSTKGYICKLDMDGNFVWAIEPVNSSSQSLSSSIDSDSEGNLYSTGWFLGNSDFDPSSDSLMLISNGDKDGYLSKLDPNGSLVWAKSFGGVEEDEGQSVNVAAIDELVLAGIFNDQIDLDTLLTETSVAQPEVFISKLDSAGNFQWSRQIHSHTNTQYLTIESDVSGNVLCGGKIGGTQQDLDPGPDVFLLGYGNDFFILKLDMVGEFIWAMGIGDNQGTAPQYFGLTTDDNENVYCIGKFYGEEDFDPSLNTFYLTSDQFQTDVFLFKLNPDLLTGNQEEMVLSDFTVYPNPTSGPVHIEIQTAENLETLNVFDQLGRLVQTHKTESVNYVDIQLPNSKGIYTIQLIHADGGIITRKIVKE